jgi:hypothetical protein
VCKILNSIPLVADNALNLLANRSPSLHRDSKIADATQSP